MIKSEIIEKIEEMCEGFEYTSVEKELMVSYLVYSHLNQKERSVEDISKGCVLYHEMLEKHVDIVIKNR